MKQYRVTVDYGDDRLRTYRVRAETLEAAEQFINNFVTNELLTVCASDDADEFDSRVYDDEFTVKA
jgi:hypothetical protein